MGVYNLFYEAVDSCENPSPELLEPFGFLRIVYAAYDIESAFDLFVVVASDRHHLAQKKIDKFNYVMQNLNFKDKLIVCLSSQDSITASDPDILTAFADTTAEKLNKSYKELIHDIYYKVPEEQIFDVNVRYDVAAYPQLKNGMSAKLTVDIK